MEVDLTESYDVEAIACVEIIYDFEMELFERHFVKGVAAHDGGASARLRLGALPIWM